MKELILILEATLSQDNNERMRGELALGSSFAQEETPFFLSQVLADQSLHLSLRQAAAFALLKYVKEYWSPFYQSFKGPAATPHQVKDLIRPILLASLSDPLSKIRLASAALVSEIAHPDWPDHWPTLLDQLLFLSSSSDPLNVESALRVLTDFISIDLTEDQLLPIAQKLLPHLLSIFTNTGPVSHAPITRARAALIFRQCVMTLYTVKDEYPAAVKEAVSNIVPLWIHAFLALLDSQLAPEMLAIPISVYSTLTILINSFPSTLRPVLSQILTRSASLLHSFSQPYHATYLSSSLDETPYSPQTEEESVPSDLASLVSGILDFFSVAIPKRIVQTFFVNENGGATEIYAQILKCTMQYAGITSADEETWASDPNAFIADEDDQMVVYNVRNAAIDLVVNFNETFQQNSIPILWIIFNQVCEASTQARIAGDPDWWKSYESALVLIGACAPDLIEYHKSQTQAGGELERMFTDILPGFLNASDIPFLQGRSFVLASQFTSLLPSSLLTAYIDAANSLLGGNGGVAVKVGAIRALSGFYKLENTLNANGGNAEIASRALVSIGLFVPLIRETTDSSVVLVTDAIRAALRNAGQIAGAIGEPLVAGLSEMILTVWFENPVDPVWSSSLSDLFRTLASLSSSSPDIESTMQNKIVPFLGGVLREVENDPFSIRVGSAVEILESLTACIGNGPDVEGEGVKGLPVGWYAAFANELWTVLEKSTDPSVVQNAMCVLTEVVRRDVGQLVDWKSSTNQSGLTLILSRVTSLLSPSTPESTALTSPDLLLTLLRKIPALISPYLPTILAAFLERMKDAKMPSFLQGLVGVFGWLAWADCARLVGVMAEIDQQKAGRAEESALTLLLTTWCDITDLTQSWYNQKVCIVGLAHMASYGNVGGVGDVWVNGELVVDPRNEGRIITRARAREVPDQYTKIPFRAKAFKILLKELIAQEGKKGVDAVGEGDAADAESDDGDDEWADEKNEKDIYELSDMFGMGTLDGFLNDEDGPDDRHLADDPIFQLELISYLQNMFREVYKNDPSFGGLVEAHFTELEKEALKTVLGI